MQLLNTIYEECFIPDIHIENLSTLAIKENWEYKKDKSKNKLPILRNYLMFTYKRLADLYNSDPKSNYIYISDKYISFNTGLQTDNYEDIYMIWEKNKNTKKQKWCSMGFYKESESFLLTNCKLTDRAKYINSTDELLLDTNLRIVPNLDHILQDEENVKRLPKQFQKVPYLLSILNGAISITLNRLKANYKLAVPHFYNNRIQLLLPISLNGNQNEPDIVLVIEKKKDCYRGSTCLTLDMAYNNARLLAKPENDWLIR